MLDEFFYMRYGVKCMVQINNASNNYIIRDNLKVK
jgi:hypothetical protein